MGYKRFVIFVMTAVVTTYLYSLLFVGLFMPLIDSYRLQRVSAILVLLFAIVSAIYFVYVEGFRGELVGYLLGSWILSLIALGGIFAVAIGLGFVLPSGIPTILAWVGGVVVLGIAIWVSLQRGRRDESEQ